jgi:starch phosphorylase
MLRFGATAVEQKDGQHVFQAQVFLNELDPDAVSAELYAEEQHGSAAVRHPMKRGERLVGADNGFMYTASVPATRPAADFTPRLVPQHSGAFVPLEAPFILWDDSPSWR